MITKTQTAIDAFRSGDKVKALSLFKTFKIGYTKEESETLTIYHEMLVGNRKFYESLGRDFEVVKREAEDIITNKYLK